MTNGWVKIHRKLIEKGYYKKSKYVHLWIHILLKANHKEKEFLWNDKLVKIKRGQFLTGRKQLAEETGINESSIERILKMLENEHQIEQQKTNLFRVITIVKYDLYQVSEQQNEQPVNNKRTTSEQPVNTNKNDKNENNDKKSFLEMKNTFLSYYKKKKDLDYYFTGKDAGCLKQLTNKLKSTLKSVGKEANLTDTFTGFLNAINDEWIIENLSIPIINSKYNEILSKIRKGRGTKGYRGDDKYEKAIQLLEDRERADK